MFRLLVDHDTGQVAEGGTRLHIFLVRQRGDAPFKVTQTILDVVDEGRDVPVAHGHHGGVAGLERAGVVQASRGQLGVLAAGIRVFQGQREVVEVLQFVILAAQQRELAVVHREVDDCGQPGVVVAAILAVALAGHFLRQRRVFLPRHVVGGVSHARRVKQGLVVEQHPEVRAERQRVLRVVQRVVGFHAHEAGQIVVVLGNVVSQRLREALLRPVHDVDVLLDHEQVAGVAAGKHRAGLGVPVLRRHVNVFNGHTGVGCFKGFLLRLIVRRRADVPRDDGQRRVFFRRCEARHAQHHCDRQYQREQLFHALVPPLESLSERVHSRPIRF